MNKNYQMVQGLVSARRRNHGNGYHNLARDFDYDYVIGILGGEELLKKKYHDVYRMLQAARRADREGNVSQSAISAAEGTGLTDAMNIRTLNFHPATTLETTSCMDMAQENPSIVIIGDVSDVVSKKSIDGFAVADNYSSYLKGSVKVPSVSLLRERERHFIAASTFCWTEQNDVGEYLLRSRTEVSEAVKTIGTGSVVTSMTVAAPMPVRHSGGDKTTIYYNRKGLLDDSLWDYYYEDVASAEDRINISLPFKGSAVFLDGFAPKAEIDWNEDFYLYIENVKNGVASFNLSQRSNVKLQVSGQTLSWEFPEDWKAPIAKNALAGAQELVFYCHMYIPTERGISVPLTIQSDNIVHDDPSYAQIPKLDILWGCFAGDTLITMADGSKKKIREIEPGEEVKTRDGSCRAEDVIQGPAERLFLIRTSKGKQIRLTEDHPLLTADGLKMAKDLTWGDILAMEYGRDAIEELHLITYGDTVYSLLLEREELLIADGFFAGDFSAQNKVMKQMETVEKERKNRKLEPFQEELKELVTALQKERGERHEREYGERSL